MSGRRIASMMRAAGLFIAGLGGCASHAVAVTDPASGPAPTEASSVSRAPVVASAAAGDAGSRLDGAKPEATPTFAERLASAVAARSSEAVEYVDVLGEGQGAWDPAPREVRDGRTNCVVWVQSVLADAYGAGSAERRLRALDRLRYYGGVPAFGLRKHYADQWIASDPGPLRPLPQGACPGAATLTVTLAPRTLAKRAGYRCALLHEAERRVQVTYFPTDAAIPCAKTLAPGTYYGMAVATTRYLQRFGAASGPMGLVHALLVEVPERGEPVLRHASITSGTVLTEGFADYAGRTRSVYRGFTFHRLDPNWDPAGAAASDDGAAAIRACEARLVEAGERRQSPRDFAQSSSPTGH